MEWSTQAHTRVPSSLESHVSSLELPSSLCCVWQNFNFAILLFLCDHPFAQNCEVVVSTKKYTKILECNFLTLCCSCLFFPCWRRNEKNMIVIIHMMNLSNSELERLFFELLVKNYLLRTQCSNKITSLCKV